MDALAIGRRLVPFGFHALPVDVRASAWCWAGFLHAFHCEDAVFVPMARLVALPRPTSCWLAGPPLPSEMMIPLEERDEFSALPKGATETEEF